LLRNTLLLLNADGKRLPKEEVYIEQLVTADNNGGNVACTVLIKVACGRFAKEMPSACANSRNL